MVIPLSPSKIPNEIVQFFSLEGNFTLLIKGSAGTGKTIFALECLKNLTNPNCSIYFSTRTHPNAVYSQHPWIKDFLAPENIVDTTGSPFILTRQADTEMPREFLRYSTLPDFLKYVYSRIEEINKRGQPFLVVDSFDAVCNFLNMPFERVATEFINFAQSLNIKTILISEHTEERVLDYIADGVVEMRCTFLKGRIFRKMILKKLRGVAIKSPIYHFTLNDGRFISFSSINLGDILRSALKNRYAFNLGIR